VSALFNILSLDPVQYLTLGKYTRAPTANVPGRRYSKKRPMRHKGRMCGADNSKAWLVS
jgi:hypothetical protein